jgi:hypothetical protein
MRTIGTLGVNCIWWAKNVVHFLELQVITSYCSGDGGRISHRKFGEGEYGARSTDTEYGVQRTLVLSSTASSERERQRGYSVLRTATGHLRICAAPYLASKPESGGVAGISRSPWGAPWEDQGDFLRFPCLFFSQVSMIRTPYSICTPLRLSD